MNRNQRVIWSDNGVLKDVTLAMSDYRSDTLTFPFVTADDYLFIASELPFNSRYFEVSSANAVDATLSVWLWDGSEWVATKDLLDNTKAQPFGAKSLAVSGEVTYAQDIDHAGWSCERISGDIEGLENTSIFNMYWTRWRWSADLTGSTALKYIGYLFADDDDLYTYYPDLQNSNLKTAFETGKTDWREQEFAASEAIIRDLKKRNIIVTRDQIFDTSLLLEAGCHKTAELIFGGLGSAYVEARGRAAEAYGKAMDLNFFRVDLAGDGTLDASDKRRTMGFLTR